MKEIWRDIPGFEGLYQASNLGEIKSLEKEVWNAHQMIARPEKILKPFSDKKGYLRVKLYKSGRNYTKKIHRLIAQTFLSNPDNKPEVNHEDGNKSNNKVNNLSWATTEENIRHAYKNGLIKRKKGKDNQLSKRVCQYDLQGNFIKEWECISKAQKELKIKNISMVCCGKRNRAGMWLWRYK